MSYLKTIDYLIGSGQPIEFEGNKLLLFRTAELTGTYELRNNNKGLKVGDYTVEQNERDIILKFTPELSKSSYKLLFSLE